MASFNPFKKNFERYSEGVIEPRLGWVIFPQHIIGQERKMRQKFYGQWVQIKSPYGCIYRTASLNPTLAGSASNDGDACLALDWHGWLELCGDNDARGKLLLEVRPARWYKVATIAFFSHPDPFMRLSSYWVLLALVLGYLLGKFF